MCLGGAGTGAFLMLPTQVRDIKGPGTNYGRRHTQRHATSLKVSRRYLDVLNQVFGHGLTSFSHVIWKVYKVQAQKQGENKMSENKSTKWWLCSNLEEQHF